MGNLELAMGLNLVQHDSGAVLQVGRKDGEL
jgi:hypothetical protein